MELAITGSRTFNDKSALAAAIAEINPTAIITSECKGTDSLAVSYANAHGIPCAIVLPKHKTDNAIKYHPRYFHMRNREIVNAADHVLAFWDGTSKGTKSTMDYARKTGTPLTVIRYR